MKKLVRPFLTAVGLTAWVAFAEPKAAPGAAQGAADEMWQKVESAMQGMQLPRQKPKTREESIAMMARELGEFDKAEAAFEASHPADARRWQAQLFFATTLELRKRLGMEVRGELPSILNRILQAPDASEEAKGDASAILLLESAADAQAGAIKMEDWVAGAEKHLQERKVSRLNDAVAQRLARMKSRMELRSKPLDLKFTALDGTEFDLSKLRGKVVLIDFWSTTCPPCVAEMPRLVKAYESLHGRGFEIVGITLDQSRTVLGEFMKAQGMKWPQYFDGKGADNDLRRRFGIETLPAMWLLDKKGMVVSEDVFGHVEEMVEKQLKE